MNKNRARVIAFYLPQFHPIPENNKWWGKGFTEWTNVAKAKPLFKGHYQPHIPSDLGFYDLRIPEVREAQAELAREAGIEGFCYWQYWFDKDKQLLDMPFNEVLNSGKPDLPFCLGWANHSWSNKTWEKRSGFVKDEVFVEPLYSLENYKEHFYYNLKAFQDKRYITVEGKPIFVVFNPKELPNAQEFIQTWQELSIKNGLKGIHFVGITHNAAFRDSNKLENNKIGLPNFNDASKFYNHILGLGFDAVNSRGQLRAEMMINGKLKTAIIKFLRKFLKIHLLNKYNHADILKHMYVKEDRWENVYPTILPNYDRSPRGGKRAGIYFNSTPELFEKNIKIALDLVKERSFEHKIIFLKSWNEWGEGNHVEPDLKYGHGYLEALKKLINTQRI